MSSDRDNSSIDFWDLHLDEYNLYQESKQVDIYLMFCNTWTLLQINQEIDINRKMKKINTQKKKV